MARIPLFDSPAELAEIGIRAKQITAEEFAPLTTACACPDDEREDGTVIKAHRTDCRHHAANPAPSSFVLPPQQQPQRAAWDGRRTVMRQAQCPAAAYLQDLHLRTEPPRLRLITTVMRSITGESFVVVERVERAE